MIKAIIFDMDGVLVNSTKYIWKSFNILLKKSGIHFSNEDIKKYLGMSLRDQLRLWKQEYGIKKYDVKEFSKKAEEIELELMKNKLIPNKDLNNLIKQAKDNNIKLAVATSSLRRRAEKILDLLKMKDNFDEIITAEDVEDHKPAPDIFLEAAKQLDVNPEDCVVIEDSANGIESAKRGNMRTIGLVTEFHSAEELKDADLIINNFSELNIQKLMDLFKE